VSRLLALVAVVVITASCGSSGTASTPTPTRAAGTPTPSGSPVVRTFKLSGIQTRATGTITVTTQSDLLSVELKITGLQSTSSHISHVHAGSCQKHGGIVFALNQVVASGDGTADVKTTFKARFPPATGTYYAVVHAGPDMQGTNSNYLLCGNLFK
jgi:hypothetical protein